MDASLRMQPIQISCMNGNHPYCIFAKIEEGIYFHIYYMICITYMFLPDRPFNFRRQ